MHSNLNNKSNEHITIKPFEQKYNEQVINLISSIQQQEFNVQVTAQEQPDLRDISGFFKKGQFFSCSRK